MSCDAYCDGVQCSLPRHHSCYCDKHRLQERALYHFYKFVERKCEWYQYKELESDDIDKLAEAHYLLSIAIGARQIHTIRYFRDDRCEGHEQRVLWLASDRNKVEESILRADYGIIGQREATQGIRDILLEAVEKFDEELPEADFQRLLTELPAIQIVPKDTPGARTKATDDAKREALKSYYSLGDW